MIRNLEHAAQLAAAMAAQAITDSEALKGFEEKFSQHCMEFFEESQRYRFTGESLFLRGAGKGYFENMTLSGWSGLKPEIRLAFTLYCVNVPILAAFIPPPPVEQVKAARDPTRGFESINHDEENTGTIYDRENFGAPKGAAEPQIASVEASNGTQVGVDNQGSETLPGEPQRLENTGRPESAAQAVHGRSASDDTGGVAGENSMKVRSNVEEQAAHGEAGQQQQEGDQGTTELQTGQAGTEVERAAGDNDTGQSAASGTDQGNAAGDHQDVTQNTDTEADLDAGKPSDPAAPAPQPDKPIIPASPDDDRDDPHSGGDVVEEAGGDAGEDDDDEEGDEDDGVVGDEPPPAPAPSKRKKHRR